MKSKKFRVKVTVQIKNKDIKLWNEVSMSLDGDKRNLDDVRREFLLVRQDVNSFVNEQGLALRDVDIFIDM